MFRVKTNQRGFAAIEAILIVIIVAVVGGTGYYVYHANKKTDNLLKTSSAKTDNSPNGGKGGGGDSHAQTGPAKTEVLIIHEWNVSAAIPAPPAQAALIQYQIMGGPPASAAFTTQELIDAAPACTADRAPAGIISRAAPTDPFYLEDGAPSGKTVEQQLTSGGNTFKPFKKAGNYYYWYTPAQAACGASAAVASLQSVAAAQVKQIVTHIQQD